MAKFSFDVVLTNGACIHVSASGAASYPDCLSQLRAEAVEGLRQAVAHVLAAADVEGEDAAQA